MNMIIELKDGLTPPPAIVYTQDETNYNYGRNTTDNFCIDPLRDWAKELGSPVEYRKPLPYEIIENDTASDGTMLGKGFLSHLSKAYSRHYKIAVNPQDFWFIVVCEIAAIVAEKPDAYRSIFTNAEDKQTILVPSGSHILPVDLVIEQLNTLIPNGAAKHFLPKFSTATADSDYAIACALLHTVKHYYNYSMFCCGLPAVKVNGTREDWDHFAFKLTQLRGVFNDTPVVQYLQRVHELITELTYATFEGDAKAFWESIFAKQNIGSGGQAILSGWISRLYTSRKDTKVENFEKSLAIVPYDNVTTGDKYLMIVGGFFAVPDADGFYVTTYPKVVARAKKL